MDGWGIAARPWCAAGLWLLAACLPGAPGTATAAAAAAAVQEPAGYWTGEINGPVPATLEGGRVLHAREAAAWLKQPGAIVIDVSNAPRRPPELAPGAPWLPLPHRALPGAVWLPGVGAGETELKLAAYYRERLSALTGGDLDAPLLVYCHERCWLSWNAAKRAVSFGYRRVAWFPDGIEGWTAAGYPSAVVEAHALEGAASADGSSAGSAEGGAALPKLAVLDLELKGDLGGPDFTAQHDARLREESTRLRLALARSGLYRIVDVEAARDTIDRLKSQQAYLHDCNGCDLDVGRQLNADLIMVAWVDRVSNLILSLTYEIHDVHSGQIVARKSFDFRGDNDSAWNHAIDYMVRDLRTVK